MIHLLYDISFEENIEHLLQKLSISDKNKNNNNKDKNKENNNYNNVQGTSGKFNKLCNDVCA